LLTNRSDGFKIQSIIKWPRLFYPS
jgi:hypothetical protein